MASKDTKDPNQECKQIKRIKPEYVSSEDVAREIGMNYRTLPTFEKGMFDNIYTKHYSLQTNELLKCAWTVYKKNIESKVFMPFQFPDHRDLHFYNGAIRYLPSLSVHKFPEHRMKLKAGPGVDSYGQMPVPNELMLKRSLEPSKPPKKITKNVKKHVK